jgi:hypothetical protein
MKKLAMVAVLFAVAFAAVGCGDTKPTTKATTVTETKTTASKSVSIEFARADRMSGRLVCFCG